MLKRFHISKLSMFFCAFYVFTTLGCFYLAYGADAKSNFVFLQVPIALQLALLSLLGIDTLFKGLPWAVVYLLIMLPTFLLLIWVGNMIGRFLKNLFNA